MAGRKRAQSFFITINNVDWTKTTLGDWFKIDNLMEELASGEESYSPPLDPETEQIGDGDPGKHQHIYVKFTEKLLYNEFKDILDIFLGQEETHSTNIQVCRSKKSVLLYLSKEDRAPYLYNVRVSELSLFARAWYHARKTYRFPQAINKAYAFIVSCGQNAGFAITIMEQQVEKLRKQKAQERQIYQPNHRCNITHDFISTHQSKTHMHTRRTRYG